MLGSTARRHIDGGASCDACAGSLIRACKELGPIDAVISTIAIDRRG
jgi:hypothetical protein